MLSHLRRQLLQTEKFARVFKKTFNNMDDKQLYILKANLTLILATIKKGHLRAASSSYQLLFSRRGGVWNGTLTINAPLILKMRDIIFFLRANYIMGHFKGYFEGAKTFLTPKLSRAQRGANFGVKKVEAPSKYPEKWPIMKFAQNQKKYYPKFSKISGALVFLCPFATRALNFITLCFNFLYFFIVLIMICGENPAKYPSLAKNLPKYTTAYIVQQSNCRWHCEPTCFSS